MRKNAYRERIVTRQRPPLCVEKTPAQSSETTVSIQITAQRNKIPNCQLKDAKSPADLEALSLVVNSKHKVIICLDHRTLVNADKLESHFHHAKGHSLSRIVEQKNRIHGLINEGHLQCGTPETPRLPVPPLPHLPHPIQGFHCTECPYAIANEKGLREHERNGHVMQPGLVQRVQHRTYWKVEAKKNPPPRPELDEKSSNQIKLMTDELFRPKLPAVPESHAHM